MSENYTSVPDPNNPEPTHITDSASLASNEAASYQPVSYGSVTPSSYYGSSAVTKPNDENSWSGIGKVGFILSIVVLVIGLILAVLIALDSVEVFRIDRMRPRTSEVSTRYEEQVSLMAMKGIGMGVVSLFGIAALIISLIGIFSRRGRSAGAWGLIVSLAAPLLISGVWSAIALPTILGG